MEINNGFEMGQKVADRLLKNGTIDQRETRRLLGSWTLQLANWLTDECDLPRSEAMKKAHLTRKILDGLGRGVMTFAYRKQNGELRRALGTLCPGVSADFDGYVYKHEDREAFSRVMERGVFVYFDLERKAFRSFAAKNVEGL